MIECVYVYGREREGERQREKEKEKERERGDRGRETDQPSDHFLLNETGFSGVIQFSSW